MGAFEALSTSDRSERLLVWSRLLMEEASGSLLTSDEAGDF